MFPRQYLRDGFAPRQSHSIPGKVALQGDSSNSAVLILHLFLAGFWLFQLFGSVQGCFVPQHLNQPRVDPHGHPKHGTVRVTGTRIVNHRMLKKKKKKKKNKKKKPKPGGSLPA